MDKSLRVNPYEPAVCQSSDPIQLQRKRRNSVLIDTLLLMSMIVGAFSMLLVIGSLFYVVIVSAF
jgi:hypothetical protein